MLDGSIFFHGGRILCEYIYEFITMNDYFKEDGHLLIS